VSIKILLRESFTFLFLFIMAERAGYGVKRDIKIVQGEDSIFPLICNKCIENHNNIRILRNR
jgi:hypothetical protein